MFAEDPSGLRLITTKPDGELGWTDWTESKMWPFNTQLRSLIPIFS